MLALAVAEVPLGLGEAPGHAEFLGDHVGQAFEQGDLEFGGAARLGAVHAQRAGLLPFGGVDRRAAGEPDVAGGGEGVGGEPRVHRGIGHDHRSFAVNHVGAERVGPGG